MKLPKFQDSSGKESSSFTMSWIAFNVITIWLVSFIILPLFGITTVPAFDGTSAMAYLTPVLALYFGRRYKKEGE